MLAIPGDKLGSIRDALGDAADDVTMADITDFGRNPGRIIAGQHAFIDAHPDQHVRVIAEPAWTGRTEHEYLACLQHEALTNIAFAGSNITGLCPYDASGLDETVLGHVRLTHPQVWQGGSRRHCPGIRRRRRTRPVQPTAGDPPGRGDAHRRASAGSGRRPPMCRTLWTTGRNGLRTVSPTCCWSPPSWPPTASITPADRAGWRSGTTADSWSARPATWATGRPTCRPAPAARGGSAGPYGLFVVNAIADLLRTHTTSAGTTIHAYLLRDDPSEQAECV